MTTLIEERNNTRSVESFAEWFVRSPLAKSMLEDGHPFKMFLPIKSRETDSWGGVEITIACVSESRVIEGRSELPSPERGNGYSSNPHGPLKPGDFGVHSHPDTAKLMADPCPKTPLL